jgi:hypothetical protein
VDCRKQLWAYVLQLPQNKADFDRFMNRPQLPQARNLCAAKNAGKKTYEIVNALIHWHAPLMNCDWLPCLVQKLVRAFRNDAIFAFEVVISLLTNLFGDWISDMPGPPPEVLARMDAILANHDTALRVSLDTAMVIWPIYRSIFAEILYEENWLNVMDIIISSYPQFLEFLVVAWVDMNGSQLKIDHRIFHATKRSINVQKLVATAENVAAECSESLCVRRKFRPITAPHYPLIDLNANAMALGTLQSDYDYLATLQQKVHEERTEADEAEIINERKKQTYESIQQQHRAKEAEDRIAAAAAISALDEQIKRLKLEGKLFRIADEKQLLESWKADWEVGIDLSLSRPPTTELNSGDNDVIVDQDAIRLQSLSNLGQSDQMVREARRSAVVRSRQSRSELDAQLRNRALRGEVRRLASNPRLLMNASPLKPKNKS